MKLVKIGDIWVNPEQVKAVAPQASNPENTFIYLNEEQYFVVPVHADEVARMLTEPAAPAFDWPFPTKVPE